MTPQEIIFSSPAVSFPFLIFSFMVLGAGIKYIDDAFDEKTYSKMKALLLSPVIAIFWVFVMYLSAPAATILGAIFLAVLLRNKVDNIGFHVGAIAIIFVIALLYFFKIVNFDWPVLIFLTVAGILDEIANDWVDTHPKVHPAVYTFFEWRFIMKIAVFICVLLNFFRIEYFLAFLGFDIAYASVALYSAKLKKELKVNYQNIQL